MIISQRNFTKLAGLLTVTLILPFLSSCFSSTESAVVGHWQEVGAGTDTMELFKDGTITVNSLGMNMAGQYSFVEKDRIKVELGGLGALAGPIVMTVSFSSDQMTWTTQDGSTTSYTRIK